MKWEDIVEKDPDKWVALNNVKKDGPDIISADVIDVVTDDDIIEYEDEHDGENLIFRRTTEWNGYPFSVELY